MILFLKSNDSDPKGGQQEERCRFEFYFWTVIFIRMSSLFCLGHTRKDVQIFHCYQNTRYPRASYSNSFLPRFPFSSISEYVRNSFWWIFVKDAFIVRNGLGDIFQN